MSRDPYSTRDWVNEQLEDIREGTSKIAVDGSPLARHQMFKLVLELGMVIARAIADVADAVRPEDRR